METMQLVSEAKTSPIDRYKDRLERIQASENRKVQYDLAIKSKEFFSGSKLTETERLLCVDNKIQRGALMASTAIFLEAIEKKKNPETVVKELHKEVKDLKVEKQ